MLCSRKSAVMTTSVVSVDVHRDDEQKTTPSNQSDKMADMEHVTMLMSRGRAGYGFTVTGAFPAKVGRVETGSTSHQAGLEAQDHIVRINGQNVHSLDMSAVAAIVKSCDRQMLIDVHRFNPSLNLVDTIGVVAENGELARLRNGNHGNVDVHSDGETKHGAVAKNKQEGNHGIHGVDFIGLSTLSRLKQQIGSESGKSSGFSSWNDDVVSDSSESDATSYTTDETPRVLKPWKRVPNKLPWELYHQLKERQTELIHNCDSCQSESEYSYFSDTESNYSCSTINIDKENLPHSKMMRYSNSPPLTSQSNDVTKQVKRGLSYRDSDSVSTITPELPPRKTSYQSKLDKVPPPLPEYSANNESQLSEDSGLEMVSHLPISYNGLSQDELNKQNIIFRLYEAEVQLRDCLRLGITQYMEPFRNNVVTSEQHDTLFQNIEQICRQSEHLVSSIRANQISYCDVMDTKQRHIDNIGNILSSRIDEMCVQYEQYCSGVRNSLTLFMSLRKLKDFDAYITDLSKDCSVKFTSFIQKPIEHMKNLTLTVQRIYKLTDSRHHDYESLQEVVRALRRCTGNISQEYIRQSQSNLTSMTSQTRSSTLSNSSRSRSNSRSRSRSTSRSRSNSVTSSVDSEVIDIQNRLVFPENTKTFQLTNIARHVIYTGDLLYEQNSKWNQVHAILMNDVLLITRREADNFLHVQHAPILLQDIRACAPSTSKHPAEFQLKVECHHCQPLGFEPAYHNFRAPSLELKCVWKNLLEQRVSLVNSQRQLTLAKVAELL